MNQFPTSTQVLKACGYYDSMDLMPAANSLVGKSRGSALAKAVHWIGYDKEPEWREPHPELDGFLDGYRKFKREHIWTLMQHEQLFISETNRIAAHPDQLGHLDVSPKMLCNLEIKTGAMPNFVHLQTALQNLAMDRGAMMPRYCLHLPGDGTYKLIAYTDVRDFAKARNLIENVWIRSETMGRFWLKETDDATVGK